jgi:hypothetical protein
MNLKSDAKLRRIYAHSKKTHRFFSNFYGQTLAIWTNQAKMLKTCPNHYQSALNMKESIIN